MGKLKKIWLYMVGITPTTYTTLSIILLENNYYFGNITCLAYKK